MKISLKVRLALLVSLGTAVLSSAAAYGIWRLSRDAGAEQTDLMLRSPGRRLTERTGWNSDWKRFDESLTLVFGASWNEDGICRVVGHGPRFKVFYESENWPEDILVQHPDGEGLPPKPKGAHLFEVRPPYLYDASTGKGERWRMVNLANSDLTMHLGVRVDRQEEASKALALLLGSIASGLSGLVFGLTWLVARQSLRPVEEISETARALTARHLNHRVDPTGRYDTEFRKLTGVFNGMLERLERSFHQSARFSADASHELKTPITNLFAEVTARLNTCEPGSEEQQFLGSMVQELERLRSVLGGLLLLSRADTGLLELSRETVDLLDFLDQSKDDYAALANDANLQFAADLDLPDGSRMVSADPIMLSQAFHNLARNAVNYNCPGGTIWLDARPGQAGEIEIRMANTGPPVPEALRPVLFDRFRKGEGGGHGLGLNIVQEVIGAHGGDVRLERSDRERTVFIVTLPVLHPTPGPATSFLNRA